jgi:pimeloyl-ACP methyl ester carboxylesterase/tRNA A-37 threonylcarbamoyl transferase component Bud32
MTSSNPYGFQQEIRFCTTPDGVRIAYATLGTGPPLVKAANWLSHLEFDRESPVWRHWLRELSRDHKLVRYDERGCGLSDRDVEFAFEAWVDDLEAVVDALGLDRFPLLGISQGGAVAIDYAVRHPERVSHLILYGAYAAGWKHRSDPGEEEERRALMTLMRQGWGRDNPAYRHLFTNLFLPEGTPEQAEWFNELQRISTSPDNAVRFQETFGDIDVRHLLAQVSVPTLVLHARNEARVPFEAGRVLASGIPDSRFVALDSKNHLILEPEPAWTQFVTEVRSFLGLQGGPLEAPLLHERAEYGSGRLPGSSPPAPASGLRDPYQVLRGELSQRYEVEVEVGRGGMATVFRARERKHQRPVAIKVIHPELTVGEGAQRFEREIQITSHLQHPHIVPLLDSGVAGGLLFYVTPFIKGASLRDHLRRGDRLSLERVLKIVGDVAAALDHAHRQGVVHRDVKPANIMISEGQGIVTDFGIAKALRDERDSALTATGAVMGTMAYMSPEQLSGEHDVDGRSDVFSLGCVVYEMLAGRHPFDGDSARAGGLSRRAPGLRTLRPDVPPHVERAVERAMDEDPGHRFATPGALVAALAAPDVPSRKMPMVVRGAAVVGLLALVLWLLTLL